MERQLGGAAEQVADALRVVHAGHLDGDAAAALLLDGRLGDAEAVHALADDLYGARERLGHLGAEVGLHLGVRRACVDAGLGVAEVARQARVGPLGLDGVGKQRHVVLGRRAGLLGGRADGVLEHLVGAAFGELGEQRAGADLEGDVHSAL